MSVSASSTMLPTLIIVCGLPATGKSTLAVELAKTLGWPSFSKDDFKELLWDSGADETETPDLALSEDIGRQGIATLLFITRRLIESDVSCVMEADFLPEFAQHDLEPFTHAANVRQVHCTLPAPEVLQRYADRSESGERHPIHAGTEALGELATNIQHGAGDPLPLTAPLLQVDTTEGYAPAFEDIVAFCRT